MKVLPINKKFNFLIFVTIVSIIVFILVNHKQIIPNSFISPTSTPYYVTTTPDLKMYQNAEFGFEFQYPKDWSFHENTFYSPFSKFNLIGTSPEENNHPNPIMPSILVNIVTLDFADKTIISFKNLNANTSSIKVADIKGIKYEYEFENIPRIGIDLPLKEYHILLGGKKEYEDTFNQLLASFKFLK